MPLRTVFRSAHFGTSTRDVSSNFVVDKEVTATAGAGKSVVIASNRRSHQICAVKKFVKGHTFAEESFHRDVNVLSKIKHPHIMEMYAAFEDEQSYFTCTPYAEDGDLLQYVQSRPRLGEQHALGIFKQILQGLEYLHSHGVSHRDLKLEHIILHRGAVKILNFGCSHWRCPNDPRYARVFSGTPCYMAPELVKVLPHVPEQADMWACGVLLHALLARGMVVPDLPPNELAPFILNLDSSFLVKVPDLSHVSRPTLALLRRLLNRTPHLRPTPAEALEHLRSYDVTAIPSPASFLTECKTRAGGVDTASCVVAPRYKDEQVITSGPFKSVLLATDCSGRQCAFKIFRKWLFAFEHLRKRVNLEVKILTHLKHPHIVDFVGTYEEQNRFMVATAWATGGDLLKYVQARPRLDEQHALGIFKQILLGLEYLHSQGVSHRDMKLENIVLHRGAVKILNFGLAHWRSPGEPRAVNNFCGSPHYMAPEIVAKAPHIPEKADMWACGVLLHHLLTRRSVFPDLPADRLAPLVLSFDSSALIKAPHLSHVSPPTLALLRHLLDHTPHLRPNPVNALEHLRSYEVIATPSPASRLEESKEREQESAGGVGTANCALAPRYAAERVLTAGPFKSVLLATECSSGRNCAVKIFDKSHRNGKKMAKSIPGEIKILTQVKHPNIVDFVGTYEEQNRFVVATAWATGGDLLKYVQARPRLDEHHALTIFQGLLQALAYLHHNGVSHRDIKLENVVLHRGAVKLINFGLSHWRSPGEPQAMHTFSGSPPYMAPEIVANAPHVPEKADMWACGVLLYALLTRIMVFPDLPLRQLRPIIQNPTTAAAMLNSHLLAHVSPPTVQLLRRLLHPTPSCRPSPDEALQHLRSYDIITKPSPAPPFAGSKSHQQRSKRSNIFQDETFQRQERIESPWYEAICAAMRRRIHASRQPKKVAMHSAAVAKSSPRPVPAFLGTLTRIAKRQWRRQKRGVLKCTPAKDVGACGVSKTAKRETTEAPSTMHPPRPITHRNGIHVQRRTGTAVPVRNVRRRIEPDHRFDGKAEERARENVKVDWGTQLFEGISTFFENTFAFFSGNGLTGQTS